MRRRLLLATISAVMAAVVLLGTPLAIYAARFVRDDAIADLERRTETVARALEARYAVGELIDEGTLETLAGGSGDDVFVEVRLPDGSQISVGDKPERVFDHTVVSDSGIAVKISISWWAVFWDAGTAVAWVTGIGFVAVGASVVVAVWQANRLAQPFVYLAASAEQLGAGSVRPKLQKFGIEEIDLVGAELARSGDRMAARLSSERQFSADASHQLRTPLTALTMRLEEIAVTTDKEEVRDEVEAALEQVERLVGVVTDLLGRTRESLGGATEVLPLAKVLRQQKEEWEPAFDKADREFRVGDSQATVFASPGGIAQVLATLIENSLTHGDGTTSVTARESADSNAVVIEVADEGAGVPEDLAPRIFERAVTSGKGSGLGLALARDLVIADGGRLELSQRSPAVFSIFLQAVPRVVDAERVIPHTGRIRRRRGRP